MNPIVPEFDLKGTVPNIVQNVFETMLNLPVTPGGEGVPLQEERVSGTIGIVGDGFSGAVYLHFPEPLARRAAAMMLGFGSPEEVDTTAVNDVISELANMIGGGIKSALCDGGMDCAMSTPAIVRGPAFAVELPAGTRVEQFSFQSAAECLAVEVHLKLD